ncbi:sensor histidine kinase [Methylobacterium nonmethylotrophicum]|uniref:histidine kinase n=1 Tax=Methylobacterium nonmethylotrophicum TaxID=1141884 RepID=A0A4Z0NMC8_9HYPH|nr:HAMP domain-containing sensor histidine kinase [Methylobacterium nonmethylotrophicum]TGD97728.1 HAMP domain-containing histidine kinase [Methylobacterium nonmethylotrophicum]
MHTTMAFPGGAAGSDALTRSEAARTALSRLLAIAGHDLKQPLQVALMAIDRAVRDGVAPRAAARLDLASDALQRLGRELDDLARSSQTADVPPRLQPVPLGPMLAGLQAEWRAYAETCGVKLTVRTTRLVAWTDPAMLATILRNLVGNAVKYARPGGRVVVGCRRRGARIEVTVLDDGAGIAPEKLATLFEAFDRAGRRDGAGLGLGLHIVRQTAQALTIPVGVRSVVGRGSAFTVSLPGADHEGPDARDA